MKLKYYEVTITQHLPLRIPVAYSSEAEARKEVEGMEDLNEYFNCYADGATYTIEKVKRISRKQCDELIHDSGFCVQTSRGFALNLEEAENKLRTAYSSPSIPCKDEEAE